MNKLTNTLPAGIEQRLQDLAQMFGGLTYTHIYDFERVATKEDLKNLRTLTNLLEDEQGTNDKTSQAIVDFVKYKIGELEPIEIGRYSEVIDNWGRTESSSKPTIIAAILMKPKEFTDDMMFEGTGGYPGSYDMEEMEGKIVKVGKEVILVGRYDDKEPVKSFKLK